MIVLFVALVVGVLLIFFGRETIDKARREMSELGEVEPEKLVDKGGAPVTSSEIVYLAQSCYETRSQKVSAKELCYLVHGDIQTSSGALGGPLTSAGVPHELELFSAGIPSLSLYYEPNKDVVQIKP